MKHKTTNSPIPLGKVWVKIDRKTWIETSDPKSIKPLTKNNTPPGPKNFSVLYKGQIYLTKTALAKHLDISPSKLSLMLKKGTIQLGKV
jgi:hypothetical protein